MNRLVVRRIRNFSILAIISTALIWIESELSTQLVRTIFLTGWSLLVVVLLLAAYQIRKKIPMINLGTSSAWMQFHIYAGLLTFVLFFLHTGGKLPGNLFNSLLAVSYLTLFFSGLVGLFLTRIVPARLTHRGEEVIFERMPIYRNRIRKEVETLVQTEIETEDDSNVTSVVLKSLYEDHLSLFFSAPRNIFSHLAQSRIPRKKLLRFLDYQKQILNEDENKILAEIQEWTIIKDNLDYAYAMQGSLKLWLFIHVPLTYILIVLAVFHVVIISAFTGGGGTI